MILINTENDWIFDIIIRSSQLKTLWTELIKSYPIINYPVKIKLRTIKNFKALYQNNKKPSKLNRNSSKIITNQKVTNQYFSRAFL